MNSKRIFAFVLASAMVLSMAACSSEKAPEQPAESKPAETPAVTTPAAPVTPAEPSKENKGELSVSLLTAEEIEAMKSEPMYDEGIVYVYATGNCTAAPLIAQKLGLYEQYGIKAEHANSSNGIEIVGSNAAQCCVGHISSMLVPITNGVNMSFVGGAHTGCMSVFVLADSDVQEIVDLKGANIGVTWGIGGSAHNTAIRMFAKSGMDPLKDFTPVPVEMEAAIAALQNGEVDTIITSDAWAYDMVKNGTLRIVSSLIEPEFAQEPCCVMAMNNDFIKENPNMAKAVTECMKLASEWMRENPEDAIQILLDNNFISGSMEKHKDLWIPLQFNPSDKFTEAGLRNFAKDYIEYGLITSTDDVEKVMEMAWNPIAKDAGLGYDVNEVDGIWWD